MNAVLGILWDLDGTIADTAELHYRAWRETLPRFNVPFTAEQLHATFGMNNTAILQTLTGQPAPPELVAAVSEVKEASFRSVARGNVQPLPGVREWLERWRARGCAQAIASSAPQANLEVMVDELQLRPYFGALVSGADLAAKPAPDVFLKAARALGLEAARCLVIEDAIAGVAGAKRAGMRCIAVTTTNPAAALQEADLVIENLSQLTLTEIERLEQRPDARP
jgi:HAD superfamily hydrolase (TIGR01509 family)